MSLIFDWKDIKNRSKGLTFNDVLIIPAKSQVRSRKDPSLATQLTSKIKIERPFISSNMDTVTEWEMAEAMKQLGAFGIIHRFMTVGEQVEQIKKLKDLGHEHIGTSIGVNNEYQARANAVIEAGADVITVDIAHGHSVSMMETMEWLKSTHPHIEIIAGNTATPEGTKDLINAGASAIKVGIGPGSMCTTRIITGCGVPQLSAIALCSEEARKHNIPIIADGGIKTSGDIVKALSAGAQTVMLGSILSGTMETPGEIRNGKKQYRGMASKSAQVSWRGGMAEGMAAEGESTYVAIKGHASDVIHELSGGLRSGMSYVNAESLSQMPDNARFIEMTPQGHLESVAHGLNG